MVFARSGFRCLFLILGGVCCAAPAFAQNDLPVSVEEVKFQHARAAGVDDPYLEVAIELATNRVPTTPPGDYYARVEVRLELATQADRKGTRVMEYYRSQVRIATIEAGEDCVVYFYLPPEVVDRDRLDSGEPMGWRVSLTVDGQALPNARGSFSENLADPQRARSFLAQIQQQAPHNDGVLQPIYLTPFYDREAGRRDDSPTYVREEPLPQGSTGTGPESPLEGE